MDDGQFNSNDPFLRETLFDGIRPFNSGDGEDNAAETPSSGSVDMNKSTGELRTSAISAKPKLTYEQREHIRFMNVERIKDFKCLEKIGGKLVNILQGLELHTRVFSAVEQERIVRCVYQLRDRGKRGELKERTYTAPQKWMRGKGRVTLQFGCCYNYAMDRNGNPPGILKNEMVDPLPPLFKVMIRRLIRWHILPEECMPDSCIVNIYEEGDCIPPHIDSNDFVRPFCTVSFLSECHIVFGSKLKVIAAGEFAGSFAVLLPVGSVLVLNGNGADVAKHCVPAVPTKRISITFRRMDESKRPKDYVPEPDLQGIQPLQYEVERANRLNLYKKERYSRRHPARREADDASVWSSGANSTRGRTFANPVSQYPSVSEGWRDGKWICHCGFHSYSSNSQCNKCNASMTPALGMKRLASEDVVHGWDNKKLNAGITSGL